MTKPSFSEKVYVRAVMESAEVADGSYIRRLTSTFDVEAVLVSPPA